jgi:hypothetical protein
MISEWVASQFLGVSHRVVKKFYKYLLLWLVVGGIFFFLVLKFYGSRDCPTSSIKLEDIYKAATEPVKKKKKILKKHETRCRAILENIFEKPFTSVRPDFLRYPRTGKNLELDCYNSDLNLGLEYQGAQHAKFTPIFHESYQDFVGQLERDAYKDARCKELGIKVIYVPHTVPYDKLEEYIREELSLLGFN